jgi:hypothetical protein
MQLVARLPDVMPDRASERVKKIYQEVQETLRVPIVNLIFRSLANYPDYLEPEWKRLRPFLRTQRFERAADRLRAEALLEPAPPGPGVSTEAANEMDRIRAFNDTIHYVLPKLLLIATALDGADFAAGERGETAADGAAQIPSGVAAGTVKVQLVDPERASERVRQIFASVKERHGHPLVSSYYRGLANWPAFLDSAWERLNPLVHTAEYDDRRDSLVRSAEAMVHELCIASGAGGELTDERRDEVRAILAGFRTRFIPEMLVDAALIKAMLDGPATAWTSRFSAA